MTKTRLEINTDDRGVTTTELYVNGEPITDRITNITLDIGPTQPIMAEISLYVDELAVTTDVILNFVRAVLPDHIWQALIVENADDIGWMASPETSPRTFG